jgi:zinc transport system ATP-binding protein
MNIGTHGGSCGHSCCLRIQNLSVRIGKDSILRDVNLHLHCGQIVALIGPNGAGKSTLLKAVLGQREYDGVISFSVPGQRNRKPIIGYVPQSPAFDPGDPVTVADLFACCMSRRPAFLGLKRGFRNHIITCLERVHGEDLIDKRVGTLSGGELQRVLLALALDPIPNILILDEPLSGVDIEGMETLMGM